MHRCDRVGNGGAAAVPVPDARSNALAPILPATVELAEMWGSANPTELLPAEAGALGRVGEKRRADFARGRACARRALGQLGVESGPILRGPMREPVWPAGVVGSITHCEGYAAAVVGWRAGCGSVGIDAEARRPLSDGVLRTVALPEEIRMVELDRSGLPLDLLLFSAKESVFKAWFPVARTWLGFEEAAVKFDVANRTYLATIDGKAAVAGIVPRTICGRYSITESHVFTCAFWDVNIDRFCGM